MEMRLLKQVMKTENYKYLKNEKGLTDEYDKLSKELSEQMKLATMYALNEW